MPSSRPRNINPPSTPTSNVVTAPASPESESKAMKFWSALAKPFKAIGHFLVEAWDDLPLVFEAVPIIKATYPTLVSDLQSLLKAAGAFVELCVTDAKPLIAALAAFFTAAVAAVAQKMVNLAEDEAALTAAEEIYELVKSDVGKTATAFTSALSALVTAYDNTAATVEAAIAKIKSLKALDTAPASVEQSS